MPVTLWFFSVNPRFILCLLSSSLLTNEHFYYRSSIHIWIHFRILQVLWRLSLYRWSQLKLKPRTKTKGRYLSLPQDISKPWPDSDRSLCLPLSTTSWVIFLSISWSICLWNHVALWWSCVSLDGSLLSSFLWCGCARRFQRGPKQSTLQSKVFL